MSEAEALSETVPLRVLPLAGAVSDTTGGVVSGGVAAWLTIKVWPAIVSVAVRCIAAVLAPTEYVTVPLPVPAFPELTEIQDALLVEIQTQPALAVTVALPVPPLAANEALARGKREGGGRVAIYVEEKMVLKSNYYSRAALDRLSKLAARTNRTEASLLREALDDLFTKLR